MAIVSLIKYEGDNTTFVWKHPRTDFNTMSQLVVHETQEAIFFNNGQALDLFGPGRYTLETQNIPLLRHVLSIPTGGRTPFHCEVYFVNKTQQMAIKWGCDSQIQYLDPTYKFPLSVGLSGEMTLCVSDSRKLLVKIVGTEKALSQSDLVSKFRALLNSKIKPYVAKVMQSGAYSIFEIDSHMDEFSNELQDLLKDDFSEYGLKLVHFYVTNLVRPEDDPTYQRFKTLRVNRYLDVEEAKLRQQINVIEGQAQKWLNMTIKYLFVIKEILGIDDKRCWEFKHFIEETNSKMYYPPIDSNILKETENNECKRISWSKDIKSNVDYITIKEIMDKKNMNFIWELYNWEQVAKKHRSKPAEDSYAHIFNKEMHKE